MTDVRQKVVPLTVIVGAVAVLAGAAVAYTVDARLGAAALAIPLGLVILESPFAGTLLLALILPLEELSALLPGGVTLQKLAGIAVFGAWLARALLRRERIDVPLAAVPLAALVVWGGASTLWASDTTATMKAALTQVQLFAFYLLIVNVLDTPAKLRRTLHAHLAGGVALAVLALYLLHHGILQAGRAAIVVDHQLLVQSNELATVLLLPVAVALADAFDRSWPALQRLAMLLAAAVCLTTIILTMSRGALVALGAMGIVLSAATGPSLLVFGAVLVVPGIWIAGPELAQRLGEGATLLDRAAGRLDIWQVAWVMIQERPLVGLGLGCFPLVFFDYLSQATGVSLKYAAEVLATPQRFSHNAYIGTTAELGIVGLVLLVTALAFHLHAAGRASWVLSAHRHPAAGPVLVTLAGLVAVVIVAFTSDIAMCKYFWFTLALSAVARPSRQRAAAAAAVERVRRAA